MNNSIKTAAKTMAAVIAAGAMAVAPVAGTINFGAMTAMADPAKTDKGYAIVKGVESGATVKLYQLVTSDNFDANGTWGNWKVTDNAKTNNMVQLNADGTFKSADVQKLVASITANGSTWTATSTHAYSADSDTAVTGAVAGDYVSGAITPGVYLALVTPPAIAENVYIYSPMLVSIDYSGTNGAIASKPATASDQVDTNTSTYTGIAYAKKTPVELTKKISTLDGESGNKANNLADGEDMQVGDEQEFTITTTMPDYRAYITNDFTPTFTLSDNQDDGLDFKAGSISVKFNGVNRTATTDYTVSYGVFQKESANTDPTVTPSSGDDSAEDVYGTLSTDAKNSNNNANDFVITFTKQALQNYAGQSITVTFTSTLNKYATQKAVANDNDVILTYTNDYNNGTKIKTDHTYDFTFPVKVVKIDAAALSADSTETNKWTNNDTSYKTLAGATFTMTRMDATVADNTTTLSDSNKTDPTADYGKNGETARTATGDDGVATFDRLDEGYYMIKEQTQPTGYTLNNEEFFIHIVPTYKNDGTLDSYTVKQVEVKKATTGNTYTVTSETDVSNTSGIFVQGHDGDAVDTLAIKDTKMSGLPATGARSALILTIAGIAVMITVMAASRKKKIAD